MLELWWIIPEVQMKDLLSHSYFASYDDYNLYDKRFIIYKYKVFS